MWRLLLLLRRQLHVIPIYTTQIGIIVLDTHIRPILKRQIDVGCENALRHMLLLPVCTHDGPRESRGLKIMAHVQPLEFLNTFLARRIEKMLQPILHLQESLVPLIVEQVFPMPILIDLLQGLPVIVLPCTILIHLFIGWKTIDREQVDEHPILGIELLQDRTVWTLTYSSLNSLRKIS